MKKPQLLPKKIKPKPGTKPLILNNPDEEVMQPKKPQGPAKLVELGKRAKDWKYEESVKKDDDKEDSDYNESFEDYDDDEFESDDDKKDIKKALNRENRKAMKFQSKAGPITNDAKPMASNGFSDSKPSSRGEAKPRLKTPEGGFAKSRGIVMNKRKINYETSNRQQERTETLKNIIQIEFEEYDNQLNLKPQNAQDLYFNKLQTFKIHNEMVQSNDNYISKDIQTEEIQENEVSVQFPEDFNEKSTAGSSATGQDLAGFIRRVTPFMEMV